MAGFFLARLPRYAQPDDGIGRSAVPVVAAAASWMETMKMPLKKIHEIYTKSEMAIQAWRSGEIAANMHRNYQEKASERATNALAGANHIASAEEEALEQRLGTDLSSKLDEDLDMRKLTGNEVIRYMRAMGVPISGRMLGAPLPTMNEALQGLRR